MITALVAAVKSYERVAIIGSGVSGAATAYFLSELRPGVLIDVYEKAEHVGGRSDTLDASEFVVPLDAGATAIFSRNEYLTSFVNTFGLVKASDGGGKDVIGLWDGTRFRFEWPDGPALPARLLARYGLSPLRVIKAVKSAVDKLCAIYALQANNSSWSSPAELFEALGLKALTQVSAYDFFEKNLSISSQFVTEFVDGASR